MDGLVPTSAALDRIPSHARIVATPGCAAPTTLLAGLAEMAHGHDGLHLYTGLQLEDQPHLPAVRDRSLAYSTWHVTPGSRELVASGAAAHLPLRLSDVPDALRRLEVDVALIRVSPPAADGTVSLGPSMSYSRAAVEVADVVLAEVDPALPRTNGPTRLHVADIDALVASERPTPRYRSVQPDPQAQRIAEHLVGLLPDAPTLQLGIGQVPEALAGALVEHDVGGLRFIGLGTEPMVDLAEAGRLAEHDGEVAPITAVELMGGERLMRFADAEPRVAVHPSTQGHDPCWLAARFDRIVSINSAVQLDLLGQVNSEVVEGVQVSAVGGSADYVDAARASRDGLSIVALPSTTKRGTVSRIVSRLPAGAVTTIPRHAFDVVVTEHGVADLRGLDVRQRAEALVAVAAPDHRTRL